MIFKPRKFPFFQKAPVKALKLKVCIRINLPMMVKTRLKLY